MLLANCGVIAAYLWLTGSGTPFSGNQWLVKQANATEALPFIRAMARQVTELQTDESRIYHRVKREYAHRFINHSKEEYAVNGISTNTIESFWSQMKRSFDGTYHCVSPKYLQIYVNEFVFRYNVRQDVVYPHLLAKAGLRVQ